ncbi:MAG: redoxin domain-containing protein [Myxococcota bacterium]|nr:redoxin domain-containing protein [Myxococcota bacterium]
MSMISRMICFGAIFFMVTMVSAADLKTNRPDVSDFSLNTLKGNRFEFKSLRGKVVILSFWASWCKPCIQELTYLKRLAADNADTMEVVGVCTDAPNTLAGVRKIVKRKRLSMTIAMDTEGTVMNEMNPRGTLPFSAYVDRQGRIAATHDGFTSGDEMKIKSIVDALIAEKVSTTPAAVNPGAEPNQPPPKTVTQPTSQAAPSALPAAQPKASKTQPTTP